MTSGQYLTVISMAVSCTPRLFANMRFASSMVILPATSTVGSAKKSRSFLVIFNRGRHARFAPSGFSQRAIVTRSVPSAAAKSYWLIPNSARLALSSRWNVVESGLRTSSAIYAVASAGAASAVACASSSFASFSSQALEMTLKLLPVSLHFTTTPSRLRCLSK